ncbi:MAG: hypothetical protein AB4206_10325 [Xenococcaceae cyanobacterium]
MAVFAQNLLKLDMITWTYDGWSEEKCCEWFDNENDRDNNLFESYIKKNLERDNIKKDKYSKKAIDWLSWLAKIMMNESKTIFLIEELQPTLLESIGQKISYRISNIILGGLIVFLIVGLSWGLLDLQTGLVFGLSAGFSGGIIGFGLLKEITPFEKISFKWLLSWQKTKSSMILSLILVLIFIVTFGLIQKQINYELLDLLIGVIIYALFTFLINSVVNSKLKIEERTKPNQGIKLSRNNSIILGLIGGLIGGLFWGLLVGLIVGLDNKNLLEGIKYGFSAGIMSAIFTGGIVGLRYGGAAFIQHFNLSRILYRKGRIPKDYADFLNYATDIRLMKKIGGGYVFYHRMLMEHFARRKSN